MVELSVVVGGVSVIVGIVYGGGRTYASEREYLDEEYSGSIGVARERLEHEALDPLEGVVTTVVEFEVDRLEERLDDEHGQTDGGRSESVTSGDPGSILAEALDEHNTTEISLKDVIDSDEYDFDTDVGGEGELLERLTDELRDPMQRRRRLDEIPSEHTTYQRRARWSYYASGLLPLLAVGSVVAWQLANAGAKLLTVGAAAGVVSLVVTGGLSLWYEEKQEGLNDELVEILRETDALVDD
ncbi:hypothetical protein [Halobaculum sp. MBLA0143]|uniref:hypothetical protein n=1 Tax=Halobaculum sp. MBLA0143 TaxID=3079933 RepID=UPI003526AA30